MLTSSKFWIGVAVGVAGVWAWHAFVRPIPSNKG